MFKNIDQHLSLKNSLFLLMFLAIVGIVDASYLSAQHFLGGDVKCLLVSGCDVVLVSKYSTIFGLPVALFGLCFYIGVLFLSFLAYERKSRSLFQGLFLWSIGGLLATGWLFYVQAVLLKAFCFYCLISASLSTLIFLVSFYVFKVSGQARNERS